MNEENNQNTPILGSHGGGGGSIPFPTYPSGTYKIKFSDEYYLGLNNAHELMKGRIILLQNDDTNGGNYFVTNHVIYDDAFVDEYVSHFDTKKWMPILGGPGFSKEHSGIMYEDIILDYEMVDGMFLGREYNFAIDEEWYNKHYGEDSNKVLRTLATGLSDITRHEAYTKAQGLNWANANVPKYSAEATYKYVDLGLPSGTKWAKMNVGAKSETDPGLYFAWGETQGYTAEQVGVDKLFTWADYKFNPSGDGKTFTKYNATNGKTVLDAEDDAASVNMGGEWHMPTNGQCEELFKETKNGFVTNAGAFTQYAWSDSVGHSSPTQTTATISNWDTAGYFFFKNSYTSVTDAISAEDYLFIPAAGGCIDGKVDGVGEWGCVWSSSLNTDFVNRAWSFSFSSDGAGVSYGDRCSGPSVRGVIGNIDK